MKKPIKIVSLIFGIFAIGLFSPANSYFEALFIGTIQFPNTIKKVPNIRVYCSGHIIKTETDDDSKKLTFSIPESKNKKRFSLLITEGIQFETEENTVKYLKIDPSLQEYKFYQFELVKKNAEQNGESKDKTKSIKNHEQPENHNADYHWVIEEDHLALEDGRIPDDTVIICYKPSYIEGLQGGTKLEFPHIRIKNNILQLAGSEDQLHDTSITLLLSSLDYDTIHRSIRQEIKQDYQKTLIAPTV